MQVLPIGKTECSDLYGVYFVRLCFADVLGAELLHAQSVDHTDKNICFKQLRYHG